MRISRSDLVFAVLTSFVLVSPAYATGTQPAPAPIAGLGFGAAALVGYGYRALKRRIGR